MEFLTAIKNNEHVLVLDTADQTKLLMSYGIFKGTKIKVVKNDKWQEILLLEIEGKRLAIRKENARPITVIKINE